MVTDITGNSSPVDGVCNDMQIKPSIETNRPSNSFASPSVHVFGLRSAKVALDIFIFQSMVTNLRKGRLELSILNLLHRHRQRAHVALLLKVQSEMPASGKFCCKKRGATKKGQKVEKLEVRQDGKDEVTHSCSDKMERSVPNPSDCGDDCSSCWQCGAQSRRHCSPH